MNKRVSILSGVDRRAFLTGALALFASSAQGHAQSSAIRIACVGDSMADGLWGGLHCIGQNESCLKYRLEFGRYGQTGTGLSRSDQCDWVAEFEKLSGAYRPALNLISIGLNDQQAIIDGDSRVTYKSSGWKAAYRSRVSRMLDIGARVDAGLVWVGNPVMRDKTLQSETAALNDLVSETIAQRADPKVVYLPPWRAAPEGPDAFRQYVLAPNGARDELRAGDGIHFTALGYERVADYLIPNLLERLQTTGAEIAYPCLRS